MHGVARPREAIELLIEALNADAAILTRIATDRSRLHRLAVADPRGERLVARPVWQPLAGSIVTAAVDRVRSGSVWTLSDLDPRAVDSIDPRLLRWLADRSTREIVVIALGRHGHVFDFLEVHFTRIPTSADRAMLDDLAVSLSLSWSRRQQGILAGLLRRITAGIEEPDDSHEQVPILDASNPAGLSRTEYRVCLMLQQGLALHEVADLLGIRYSTLRSHLQRIYAKAGVRGQIALVRMLIDQRTGIGTRRAAN